MGFTEWMTWFNSKDLFCFIKSKWVDVNTGLADIKVLELTMEEQYVCHEENSAKGSMNFSIL